MKRNSSRNFTFLLVAIMLIIGFATSSNSSYLVRAQTATFGYAGSWDSSATTFGGLYLSNYTSPPNLGNITQISAFIATGGTSIKAVIYSDHNGQPGILLAQSNQVSVPGTSGVWVNFPIAYSGTPNTSYWLGILFLGSGTYFYATGKVDFAICGLPSSSSELPEKFSNATFYSGNELRVYAAFSPQTKEQPKSNSIQYFFENYLPWVVIIGLIIALLLTIAVLKSRRNVTKTQMPKIHDILEPQS